jgi:hypothetical protein
MKAVIHLDVPEYQIGQPVHVFFKDTMEKHGVCEAEQEIVRCKDCKNADYGTDEDGNRFMKCIGSVKCYGGTTPDFFCADGERRTDDA